MIKKLIKTITPYMLFYIVLLLGLLAIGLFVEHLNKMSDANLVKVLILLLTKISMYLFFGGLALGGFLCLSTFLLFSRIDIGRLVGNDNEMKFMWFMMTMINLIFFFFTSIGDLMNGDILWRLIGSLTIPLHFGSSYIVSVFNKNKSIT